ncbi:MAG: oleate hydratase [Gammaproteobacteria bacterium]
MSEVVGKAHLLGGGIASLAAAALLVRDAGFSGEQIHIYEKQGVLGGSLDGSGTPADGYLIRGGRMFEPHFACTFDLFDSISTLEDASVSVTQDIKSFTALRKSSSNCRLITDGRRVEAPEFQLSIKDKWNLLRLSLQSERALKNSTIEDYFSAHFFTTNFWIMWCTMFAFQPWHSVAEMRRYMRRFMHLLPGFNRLASIHRTRFNQYDSLVRPIVAWLETRGVNFHLNTAVVNVAFTPDNSRVTGFTYRQHDQPHEAQVRSNDRVFITLGSMTDGSSVGSMTVAPSSKLQKSDSPAWELWRELAKRSPYFGDPEAFAADIDKTRWVSFTVTLREPAFFSFMESFSRNAAGTGGLVTFSNSSWLLSIVLAHQPHFANQPDDIFVFWGYGLLSNNNGDLIKKPMHECSGEEILRELSHHLPKHDEPTEFFRTANCIPCLMPYITAQFMPREPDTRPKVVPQGAKNYAFMGQFCDLPEDTVFTVEYSVRSAQTAVYALTENAKSVTPLYRGFETPSVVYQALKIILSNGAR